MKEPKKSLFIACQQGDVSQADVSRKVFDFMEEYNRTNSCQITDRILFAGDIASLVLPQAQTFVRQTLIFLLGIGIRDHRARKIFLFGHTPCQYRGLLSADGKDEVYRQLVIAPIVIQKIFPEVDLIFENYFINKDSSPKRV